jgi:GNAT superfamily N-acetyltransferase
MIQTLTAPVPLTTDHHLNDFTCGERVLDDWLKARALHNHREGISRCFVLCADNKVVGYYCLSAGGIHREAAPGVLRRNMPDPLPIIVLRRLAMDQGYHNQGLGKALLRDAIARVIEASQYIGLVAILVHTLSISAKRFYLSCGFVESPLQPMTLMMTVKTIRMLLGEAKTATPSIS